MSRNNTCTAATSAIWKNHVTVPDTPEGFTVRTTYPTNPDGVEVMLEQWQAGSSEPPHSHPGDDMTVVVEGRMAIQFFTKSETGLVADGSPVTLNQGEAGYIQAGRIHDASYLEDCKLVYVHDRAFGFKAES
jgi:quercetin dioxygenase-like cupin family protein